MMKYALLGRLFLMSVVGVLSFETSLAQNLADYGLINDTLYVDSESTEDNTDELLELDNHQALDTIESINSINASFAKDDKSNDTPSAELVETKANIVKSKDNRRNARKQKQEIIKSDEQELGSLEKEWEPVQFNHYVGIKGGYGMGLQRFEPTKESLMHLGLYNFGFIYMFDAISKGNKYVGAVQLELEYLQKGFSYYTYKNSTKIYARNYYVIQIPLLWQPYIPFDKKGSRIFLNAGPYVNYILSSHEKLYDKESGEVVYDRNYQWDAMRDNRAEYGIAAGLGFKVAIKRFYLGMEVRYHISFANLMKGMDEYVGNAFFASPVDQLNATIQLTYRLGK